MFRQLTLIAVLLVVTGRGIYVAGPTTASVAPPLQAPPPAAAFAAGVVHVALTEPEVWGFTAFGGDLQSTLAGVYVMRQYQNGVLFAWNTGADPPYREQYSIGRSFVAYDLRHAPEGIVVSATLELAPLSGGYGLAAPVYFYRSDWAGDAPTRDAWNAPVGALLATVGPEARHVPLPALVGQPVPATLRLALRTDETSDHAGSQSTGRAFRVRPSNSSADQAISVLHLWIEAQP